MARMLPSNISQDCPSEGEKEVFRLLKDDPETADWIVLHSLDIAHHDKQISAEVDFLVIVPYKGVLVIEVKGCHKVRRKGGEWFYGNDPNPDPRGPFKQAQSNVHNLLTRLHTSKPRLSGVVFSYAVIFPFTDFLEISNEWHEWQAIDSRHLKAKPISDLITSSIGSAKSLFGSLGITTWFHPELHEPTIRQCEEIADFFRPDFEFYESPNSRKYRLAKELKHYTEEQFETLDAMEKNPRVAFTGPAGTGKTLLAIEAARRSFSQGRSVLLLCYNKLLAEMLKSQTASLSSLVTCTTIHDHMMEMTGYEMKKGEEDSEAFWTTVLPEMALNKIKNTGNSEYEELILDEAQDVLCQPNYISYISAVLKDGVRSGRWRFFGDFEQQNIFGEMPVNLKDLLDDISGGAPIYCLRANCRNTRKIAALAKTLGGMNPDYKRILRLEEGLEPKLLFYRDNDHQRQLLIEALDELYSKGCKGSDITILSRHSNKHCIASTIECDPWKGRIMPMRDFSEGCIRYASIYRFKGLESPAIIITDINEISAENSKALLYVAVTRALHQLFILADEKAKLSIDKAIYSK